MGQEPTDKKKYLVQKSIYKAALCPGPEPADEKEHLVQKECKKAALCPGQEPADKKKYGKAPVCAANRPRTGRKTLAGANRGQRKEPKGDFP